MSRDFQNFSRPRGRGRNWGQSQRNHRTRPPGLRGAEIGLYYKELNMKKKKKDPVINLKIPNSVLTALECELTTIRKIANRQNITIPTPIAQRSLKMEPFNDQLKAANINSPGSSRAQDFSPINNKDMDSSSPGPKVLPLRRMYDYKYGYEDIISGSFDEKLDQSISKGISIITYNNELDSLNEAFFIEYEDMLDRTAYRNMLKFRKKLPAYIKAKELINVINDNQVIVISGETGCGKSTQVPQIILDHAICNKKGAHTKILVTQPRRIAASSLAVRVAKERAEKLGNSVGYAVRLEKVEERSRGSIQYCTTGILLAELEVNQGLTDYSHIILDEVHERDVHVDLSMCMLQKVLKKRKDLKLILMSATLDAESLSAYFDNCPLMHIEGLAYPVQDVYLEDILDLTNFTLPAERPRAPQPKWMKYRKKNVSDAMEMDIQYRAEIGPWLESKKKSLSLLTYKTLQDSRIEELNLDLLVELLIYICKGEPGAILVFLPGIGDITKLIRIMESTGLFPSSGYEIYPLHSKLPTLEQHKIFERPPDNIRKIIIATNIAETSITIDDVVYVVDSGRIKMKGLNVERNLTTLQTEWVSQANLRQRRGRAGRCQPGVCYHLLTTHRAGKLEERTLPELQRSDLLEPVLMIKRLRLGLAESALKMVPSPPADTTIQSAVKHLQRCGALNSAETLTPLGWHLARLPVHPAAGKLLVLGALSGCLDRAASLAAVWGFKEPFQMVIGKEYEVDMVKREFAMGEPSDHIAASEAIIQWENCPGREKRSFAYRNFLSNNTLELLVDMKHQFGDNLRQMGFLSSGNVRSEWENRNASNMSLFKAIVAASLYPNVATVKWVNLNNFRKQQRISAFTPEDGKLVIHPSSVMAVPRKSQNGKGAVPNRLCNNPGANWLVYWLKQRSSDLFLLDVTLIYTLPLLFFGEFEICDDVENPENCFVTISDIKVRCKRECTDKLLELRSLLDRVLESKVNESNAPSLSSEFEESVLTTVIQLITAEDEQAEYLGNEYSDSESSTAGDRHY